MYESPINLIYKDYQTQMKEGIDRLILEAVQEVSVAVDRDELIKALNYDRQQYEKGYADGKKAVLDKIRAEIEEIKLDVDLDIGNEMIYNNAIKDVLEIIDKYREVSE